jgi:hypothetical protein
VSSLLGTLAVKLKAETAQFMRDMGDAQKALSDFKLNAKGIQQAFGAAFAGAATTIGLAVKEFHEAQSAQLRLASAAKAAGTALDVDKIVEYAGALQQVTTFGDDATVNAAAMLASFKLQEGEILKLMPLLQDVSALYGKDLADAAMSAGRAIQVGSGPLRGLGLAMSDIQKKAFDAATPMTRLQMLMQLMASQAGGTAQALGGTAGAAFLQLKMAVGDLLEEIGALLDQPLGDMLRMARDLVNDITDALKSMSPEWKKAAGFIGLAGTALMGIISGAATLKLAWPVISTGVAAVGAVMKGVFVGILPVIGAVALAIVAIIAVIGALHMAWKQNADFFIETWQKVKDKLIEIWTSFVDGFKSAMDAVSEKVTLFLAFVSGASPEEAYGIVQESKKESGGIFNPSAAAGAVSEGAGNVAAGVQEYVLKPLKDSLVNGLDLVKGALKGLIPDLKGTGKAANNAGEGLGGVEEPALKLSEAFPELYKSLDETIQKVRESMIDPNARSGGGASSLDEAIDEQVNKLAHSIGGGSYEVAGAVKGGVSVLLSAFAQGGEQLGAIAQGASQGFSAGGPWGALIGAILGWLTTMQAFKDIMALFEGNLTFLSKTVAKVLEPLAEMATTLFELIETIQTVEQITGFVGPILELFGLVMKGIGWVLNVIVQAIKQLINWILDFVAGVMDFLGFEDAADDVRGKKFDVDWDLAGAWNKTEDAADGAAEGLDGAGAAANDFGASVQGAMEELTNVPDGFKIAAARYDAIQAGVGTNDPYGGPEEENPMQVEVILSGDLGEFIARAEAKARWKNYAGSGAAIPTGGQWSIPKQPK